MSPETGSVASFVNQLHLLSNVTSILDSLVRGHGLAGQSCLWASYHNQFPNTLSMKGCGETAKGSQLIVRNGLEQRLSNQAKALHFFWRAAAGLCFVIATQCIDRLLHQRLAGYDHFLQSPFHREALMTIH